MSNETYPEKYARHPHKPGPQPKLLPRGLDHYHAGHGVGSPDGHYVCTVDTTTSQPPEQGGQSNDVWVWSTGPSSDGRM
jgi:hypothetical protein